MQEKDELLLRSGALLKKLSLGYEPLLADIYWTRAVQYYGVRARKPGATLRTAVAFAEHHHHARSQIGDCLSLRCSFSFGAAARRRRETGLGGGARQAGHRGKSGRMAALRGSGIAVFDPTKGLQKAAEAYLEGGKNPNAQIWMKVMAARVAENGQRRWRLRG